MTNWAHQILYAPDTTENKEFFFFKSQLNPQDWEEREELLAPEFWKYDQQKLILIWQRRKWASIFLFSMPDILKAQKLTATYPFEVIVKREKRLK